MHDNNAPEEIRIEQVPIHAIDTSPKWWRMDAPISERDIQSRLTWLTANPPELMNPITVRASTDAAEHWELVQGVEWLQACQRIGRTHIPVRILSVSEVDAAIWMLSQDLMIPPPRRVLQRAWWSIRILDRGGITQRALAMRIGVKESTMSGYVKFGRGVPECMTRALAAELAVPMSEVEKLPRKVLQPIVDAEDQAVHEMLLRDTLAALLPTSPASPNDSELRRAKFLRWRAWLPKLRDLLLRIGIALGMRVPPARNHTIRSSVRFQCRAPS